MSIAVTSSRPPRIAGIDSLMKRIPVARLSRMALPLALLALWQVLAELRWLPVAIIPAPTDVLNAWIKWVFGGAGPGLNPYSGTWGAGVRGSLQRILEGYAIAVVVGIPTGVLIGRSRWIRNLVDPTIQGLRPVPITAWLPLSIAIFGIKDLSALFLIGLGAFYPIVVSTAQGTRDAPTNLVRVGAMMGMNRFQSARMIILPSAAPAIFTGLRLGLGIGWTAVVVAEMVAVKSGLGFVLWDAYYIGRMDIVLADMISIGLIGLLSDRLLLLVEAHLLRWNRRNA